MEEGLVGLKELNFVIISGNCFFYEGVVSFLATLGCQNHKYYDSSFEFIKSEIQKDCDFTIIDVGSLQKFDLHALNGCDFLKSRLKILFVGNSHTEIINGLCKNYCFSGFISYNSSSEEFLKAMQTLVSGEKYVSDSIAYYPNALSREMDNEFVNRLTKRELEVLKLLCKGFDAESLAETLFISPRTVVRHKTNILKKSGFTSTLQLVTNLVDDNLLK